MVRREKIPATSGEQRDTYHHGDPKRALTEAALGLVSEKGPKGFTLREVARRAGVSAAAPAMSDMLNHAITDGRVSPRRRRHARHRIPRTRHRALVLGPKQPNPDDAESTTVRFRSLDGRDREIAVPRLTFTEPITTLAGATT